MRYNYNFLHADLGLTFQMIMHVTLYVYVLHSATTGK